MSLFQDDTERTAWDAEKFAFLYAEKSATCDVIVFVCGYKSVITL
jgi:hypothetical protein